MVAVQQKSVRDARQDELYAVDGGGNPAVVAGAFLAGVGVGLTVGAGTVVAMAVTGVAIGTAIKYARNAAKDEKDESVPVAPETPAPQ